MYGVREFSAIINPPHATILAVGAAQRRPVEAADGGVKFVSQMTVTLSCDHRVVDGALGAELLAAFKQLIESPVRMLVDARHREGHDSKCIISARHVVLTFALSFVVHGVCCRRLHACELDAPQAERMMSLDDPGAAFRRAFAWIYAGPEDKPWLMQGSLRHRVAPAMPDI